MTEEIFDICDADDRVVGQATRSEVHARNLLHRAVHIFVVNSRGELLVHRRSAAKDQFPLCFTSSASGHLGAGEDYHSAAVRELAEELHLHTPIEFLARFPAGPETAYEHSWLYRTLTDEPPVCDPTEIESAEFYRLDELAEAVARNPDEYTPPFRTLFRWYYASAGDLIHLPDDHGTV